MKRITVKLACTSYRVHIGSHLQGQAGSLLREAGLNSGRVVVITDPTVRQLHADTLEKGLTDAGLKVDTLLVPEGEQSKSLETAAQLYGELTSLHAERQTPILALGGGVIGDLSGFVAATYLRGVPLVQIPTTLLGQVDSSIGGKVAVDHGHLKNKIGAFYQPRLVISDIESLRTLSRDDLTSGLAEVIKSAVIQDRDFFAFLEHNLEAILALDSETLEETVYAAARIKADIVEKDEKEENLRAILNYGHTLGHAIESVSDFTMKHGQAVAVGMVAAARISARMGIFDKTELARLDSLIKKAGLPTRMPRLSIEKIVEATGHDKKVLRGKVRFVLPKTIGSVVITDEVSPATFEQVLIDMYEAS